LQEKYKEEVIKKHGEDFNYEEEPTDGEIDALFSLTL
jgi:hypothetical protein